MLHGFYATDNAEHQVTLILKVSGSGKLSRKFQNRSASEASDRLQTLAQRFFTVWSDPQPSDRGRGFSVATPAPELSAARLGCSEGQSPLTLAERINNYPACRGI